MSEFRNASDPITYNAIIRVGTSNTVHVKIQAANDGGAQARQIVEAQYGRDNVISVMSV